MSRRTLVGIALLFAALNLSAASPASLVDDPAARARLHGIVKGILAAWDRADVVCLGEDHGRKNDSDLRLALIEDPGFARRVSVIIVEFANSEHQDILDRFIVQGEEMTRAQLRAVWHDTASGSYVWESAIYEAFLRAVRKMNLALPAKQRVRLLGGDSSQSNRGRFIREAVSREILSKGLKGLALYGAGHCECRGGGFPGELEDQYPGKIWSAFSFYDVVEGRRVFHLGDEPKLIPITGTENAKLPAGKMFFLGRSDGSATLKDITNAIVYYGNVGDVVVPAGER